jgi:hypothetical protein
MVFPNSYTVSERGYVMLARRLRPWFQPGAYYSIYYVDTEDRYGRAQQQHDAALTLRFDINPYWLIKLEGHYLWGTAALSTTLNDMPLNHLEPSWGLFLLKTTAYF